METTKKEGAIREAYRRARNHAERSHNIAEFMYRYTRYFDIVECHPHVQEGWRRDFEPIEEAAFLEALAAARRCAAQAHRNACGCVACTIRCVEEANAAARAYERAV